MAEISFAIASGVFIEFFNSLFYFSNLNFDVAIRPIPTIPVTIAIPIVFSPNILPCHIRKAPVNANKNPNANNIFCFIKIIFNSSNK